jgi:hypothetical protein
MSVNSERICYIHAGTHKTASTYIQSRLIQNRDLLEKQRLIYEVPGRAHLTQKHRTHKSLGLAAKRLKWKKWHRYLERFSDRPENLLLSAEQFTTPLCEPKRLRRIEKILSRHGYTLRVIIFIRPQLEYINSMYAYTLRRFYHSLTFESYIEGIKRTGANHRYSYNILFNDLLNSRVGCTFLPFSKDYGDPFIQLIQALKLDPNRKYAAVVHGKENVQSGTRGVWLSRLVAAKLQKLGFTGKNLQSAAKEVHRVAEPERWHEQRYFGFSKELALKTLEHYEHGNNIFAHKVWGKNWGDVFQPTIPTQNAYSPATPEEAGRMNDLANQIISRLANRNPSLAIALKSSTTVDINGSV